MVDDARLTLLVECGNAFETSSVRSLLDGHGIDYVVQGEQHSSMIAGTLGTFVLPRVLVAERDLERARALLDATPIFSGTAPEEGASLEGSVCPVHERPAVAICTRCGTFLCGSCNSLGSPPLCEECLGRDAPAARRPWGSVVTRVVLGGLVLLFLAAIAAQAAGLF